MKVFPTCLILGLAGIDPTGVIVVISALSMGIKRSKIIMFMLTVFLTTIITGLVSSYFIVDGSIDFISNLFNYIPDNVYMVLELLVGLLLFNWFIERTFFIDKKIKKDIKKESIFSKYIKKGLFIVGVLFSISQLADPSFLALITLTAQSSNLIEKLFANIFWVLISQLPMFVLLLPILLNKHEKFINYFNNKIMTSSRIDKIKKILYILLSLIILVVSILSLTEAIYYFLTDTWLY